MSGGIFRDRASLLLSNLREGREVRAYLDRFSASGDACFAVVKVGGALMAEALSTLAERLALLQQLGLKPVVVFGSGPQLDARLEEAGVGQERVDGLRVTPPAAMPIVAAEAARTGLSLVEAMRQRGGHAVLTPPGTVTARPRDEATYGLVGEAIDVDKAAIESLLASGVVPLIGCAQLGADARLFNVNADEVARAVALALAPQKIVFLTRTGGLLDDRGRVVSTVNLATDLDDLRRADWLRGGMLLKIEEIAQLLMALPLSSSVSLTSADGLLRELFTHSGQGTLIRRGERILVEERPDPALYRPLVERAFGKTLSPRFFDEVEAAYALRTENSRAGAVVTKFSGLDLLDKFAVDPAARGEGLAKAVWRVLETRSPKLIWRSRADNPFNEFYAAQASGLLKRGRWHIFWQGRDMDAEALGAADALAARPPDFVEDAA